MKILLDECVPWPLRKVLTAQSFETAQHRGWAGIKNGELIKLAEGEFDLFVTADQNLRYQQNLEGKMIAIIELSTNKLRRLVASAELINNAIATIQPGEFRILQIP
ncbi:MAG: DUF5615 family PIN-like protein [Burkholderiales bacterium]|nr:DUF5615 family PIN-like protein [Phycisphaerae bacterium]